MTYLGLVIIALAIYLGCLEIAKAIRGHGNGRRP